MPAFGASWIYLYGAPRSYKVIGDHDELNEGLGEGVAYRGRVLLAIQTVQLGDDDAATSSVKCMKLNSSQKVCQWSTSYITCKYDIITWICMAIGRKVNIKQTNHYSSFKHATNKCTTVRS